MNKIAFKFTYNNFAHIHRLAKIYAQPKIKSMQRQTINPRSASKSPKIASVTTTFTSVSSTFMLLLLLPVATINAQENCYINESGFTCCSKSLGKCLLSVNVITFGKFVFHSKIFIGGFGILEFRKITSRP